jgi:4-carboxymuconolactone decarboxylase
VTEPRLAPVDYENLDEAGRARYQAIAESRGGMPTSFRVFMNSAGATDAVAAFGDYVRFNIDLPARALELVIMRTATILGDRYMWAHHAKLAESAGLSAGDLAAIARPPASGAAWAGSAQDADLVNFVDGQLAGTMTDAAFERVAGRLGPRLTMDLVLLTAYYALIHQLFATLNIDSPTDTREPAPAPERRNERHPHG